MISPEALAPILEDGLRHAVADSPSDFRAPVDLQKLAEFVAEGIAAECEEIQAQLWEAEATELSVGKAYRLLAAQVGFAKGPFETQEEAQRSADGLAKLYQPCAWAPEEDEDGGFMLIPLAHQAGA